MSEAAAMLAGAAQGLSEGLADPAFAAAAHSAVAEATKLAKAVAPDDRMRARIAAVGERVGDTVERTRTRLHDVAEETKIRTDAVAETGRLAIRAPARVAREVGQAAGSWLNGAAAGVGLWAAAGAMALIGLVVLTVGVVIGLDRLLGAPWGEIIVAGLYAIGFIILATRAKQSMARGRAEAGAHLRQAHEELDRVGRPLGRAFSRRPTRQPEAHMDAIMKNQGE